MDGQISSPARSDSSQAFRDTKAQHVAVGVLSAALLALGIYTLWNFLSALVWAGIFAIALWPLYRRAVQRFGTGKHNLMLPMLFTVAVALVFIVPVGLIGMELARELHALTDWLRNAREHGNPGAGHDAPPPVRRQAAVDQWWQQNLADPQAAKDLVERTSNRPRRLAQPGDRGADRPAAHVVCVHRLSPCSSCSRAATT